jgi:hypothetical protein
MMFWNIELTIANNARLSSCFRYGQIDLKVGTKDMPTIRSVDSIKGFTACGLGSWDP